MTVKFNRKRLLEACEDLYKPEIVDINHKQIEAASSYILTGACNNELNTKLTIGLPSGLQYPRTDSELINISLAQATYFLFVRTALKYNFWFIDEEKQQPWCYQNNSSNEGSDGVKALALDLFERGLFPGLHIPRVHIREKLKGFVSDMPLAESRLKVLESVANYNLFYQAIFKPMMENKQADIEFAAIIAKKFPRAYGDFFLNKAQCFLYAASGIFDQYRIMLSDNLIGCADNITPQVLRHLGILEYGVKMSEMVDSDIVLMENGDIEPSLRAMTLLACDRLVQQTGLNSMQLNSWFIEQYNSAEFKKSTYRPHLVETTKY